MIVNYKFDLEYPKASNNEKSRDVINFRMELQTG